MAKHIKKVNGKNVDINNNDAIFYGHLLKDLEPGDQSEYVHEGKTYIDTVTKKEVLPSGAVCVYSTTKEVV